MAKYKQKIGTNKYRLYVSDSFGVNGKPNRKTKVVEANSDRAAEKALQEFGLEACKNDLR